jgi:hypothetical protein
MMNHPWMTANLSNKPLGNHREALQKYQSVRKEKSAKWKNENDAPDMQ